MKTVLKEATIIVDYENGFADEKTNELYVEGGEKIAPIINEIVRETKSKGGIIIATKDMHREGNVSFAQNFIGKTPITVSLKKGETPGPDNFITLSEVQNWTEENNGLMSSAGFTVEELKVYLSTQKDFTMVLWPKHCVVNTPGSEYHKGLDSSMIDIEVLKGYKNNEHPYSAAPGIEIGTTRGLLDIIKDEEIKKVKIVGLAEEWCVGDTGKDIIEALDVTVELVRKATKAVSPENEVEYLKEMREVGMIINEG